VGIELPTVEVRFENLTIDARCHVGGRALPTLWNSVRNFFEVMKTFHSHRRCFHIDVGLVEYQVPHEISVCSENFPSIASDMLGYLSLINNKES
jgi:hypothetical protein